MMSIGIAHIVPSIDREASGLSHCVPGLHRALLAADQPSKLAVLEPLPSNMVCDSIFSFPYGFGPKRLGVSPKMKHWLRAEALSGRSQILHNHSLWMMPNVYPGAVVKGTTCKLVVSPHGTLAKQALKHSALIKSIFWPLFQGPAIRGADAFHATSEQEYLDIRARGFDQPVAVIPYGINIPELKSKTQKKLKQLLFLGRIHPIKGIDHLLRAWQAIQNRFGDWQLVIAGPDHRGYLEEMKNLARSLELERCEFIGALYGEDKVRAYQDADLYVLPTHTENFGMTIAEALSSGTPAIVTKGAPWQGLEQNGAGWWIDVGTDPLISTLEKALDLPLATLGEMGLKGREWMIDEFSWKKAGDEMAEFYNWLVNGGDIPAFVHID